MKVWATSQVAGSGSGSLLLVWKNRGVCAKSESMFLCVGSGSVRHITSLSVCRGIARTVQV